MLPKSWFLLWHSGLEFNVKIIKAWIHPFLVSIVQVAAACVHDMHTFTSLVPTEYCLNSMAYLHIFFDCCYPLTATVCISSDVLCTQTPSIVQRSTFRMLYWKPSQRNVTSTLLNLCHVELLQFRRQKEVQFGTSKVSWTDTRWIIVTDSGCF